MKEILLLNGLPRSGKDTLADYLVEHKGYQKLSFATPLKQIMASTFGISIDSLETYKNSPEEYKIVTECRNEYCVPIKTTDYRAILQRFGTEGMKPFFGDDVWANVTYELIKNSKHDKFVVADFRFLVEYIPQKNLKLKTILIKDKRDLPLEGHASDVELYQNKFLFDKVIKNTGTLEEYYEKIEDENF